MKIDRDTIKTLKKFDNEIRLLEIKESLDKAIGKCIFSKALTDKQIAKLDYILCEIEVVIHKNKDIKIQIVD